MARGHGVRSVRHRQFACQKPCRHESDDERKRYSLQHRQSRSNASNDRQSEHHDRQNMPQKLTKSMTARPSHWWPNDRRDPGDNADRQQKQQGFAGQATAQ